MFKKACILPVWITAAVCCCFVLAACSPAAQEDGPVPASSDPVAAHLVVTDWVNGDDAMLALNSGLLTELSDGCVGLQTTEENKAVLLRWPAGTKLSADGTAVVGESGTRFEFASEIGVGGGYAGMPVPSECEAALWSATYEVQQPL